MPRLLPLLAASCLAQACLGDQTELSTGAVIDAHVVPDADASRLQTVLQTPHGRIVLDRNRVARVTTETPAAEEYRRRAPSVSDTVESQYALAMWCRDNGVSDGMRRHLRRVLELAPEHEEARMLLGYQQVGGAWMTREEVLASRGLVRYEGDYRTRQEVELLKQQERLEAEARAWRDRLDGLVAALDGYDRDTARDAEQQLTTLDDPAATPELLRLLAEQTEPRVRRLLIDALGRLGTTAGLWALADVAIADPDPELRAEAVERLATDGRPGLAGPFVSALRADDPRVINNAGAALGRLGSDATIDPLIDALVTTHKRQVGNASGGDQYSVGFSGSGGGTFGFGGGGPKIIEGESRNAAVLASLVQLTGVNFLYDQQQWRAWRAAQQVEEKFDLRRDP